MSDTPKTDKACGWPCGHHGRIESSDLICSPDGPFVHSSVARELERENAKLREKFMFAESEIILLREDRDELRQAKDAYFKHNNILVELMTEEQRKKALEISISQPKEAQP